MAQDIHFSHDPQVSIQKDLSLKSSSSMKCNEFVNESKQCIRYVTEDTTPATSLSPYLSLMTEHLLKEEPDYGNLINLLNMRQSRRNSFMQDFFLKQDNLRKNLSIMDKENIQLKQEKSLLQMDLYAREQQILKLEQKLSSADQTIEKLERQTANNLYQVDCIKIELNNKNEKLLKQTYEVDNMKIKMQEKLMQEKSRMKKSMERTLASKLIELKSKLRFTDEKFKQIKEILNADDWEQLGDLNISILPRIISTEISDPSLSQITSKKKLLHRNISLTESESTKDRSLIGSVENKSINRQCLDTDYNSILDKENKSTKFFSKPSTEINFHGNPVSEITHSNSCISTKQTDASFVESEQKSVSVCTSTFSSKRVSLTNKNTNISRKLNKCLPSKENSSTTKEQIFSTEKKNVSVFSIKRESFSNFPVQSDIEEKTFCSLPYVYRIPSASPKPTCLASLRNLFSESYNLCTKNTVLANFLPKKSKSNLIDTWIEHKPIGNLELNTVLQPAIRKKKSVSKLSIHDLKNNVSKYILQHQEQDLHGAIETQLYKGEIIHSFGGGVQVIFKDVETLRQVLPPQETYNLSKRSKEILSIREVEDRCTVAVECHGIPSKISDPLQNIKWI